MTSIRRRLTVALLGTIALAVLLGGAAIHHEAREEVDELLDYQLRQLALSVGDQVWGPGFVPHGHEGGETDFVIQVWGPNGVSLYFSRPHQILPVGSEPGFSTIETREGAWRVYVTRTPLQLIQVAQPMTVRNTMALAAVTRVLTPMLLLLPVLSLLIWVIVGRGLAPLRRLARAVALRSPSGLAPLPVTDTPEEVMPLVQSLNDLLHRLDEALAAQKAFVADAAHELRTPIAALQLQVQMLERATNDDERRGALDDLQAGVRRGTHLVNQLLTLARQDPDLTDRSKAPVNLGALARSTVAEHAVAAEERRIDLGVTHVDDAAVIEGNADSLHILLRNLVDNALRYTPAGGAVDVAVAVSGPDAVLDVADNGPGIPPEDRQRVFDRFYRGTGTGETGTGLGLSIVKSIADRHGAHVELGSSAAGGLSVRVRFPLFPRTEGQRRGG